MRKSSSKLPRQGRQAAAHTVCMHTQGWIWHLGGMLGQGVVKKNTPGARCTLHDARRIPEINPSPILYFIFLKDAFTEGALALVAGRWHGARGGTIYCPRVMLAAHWIKA